MPKSLTEPDAFAVWTRLIRAHARAMGAVEAALKAAGQPPLAWYDVLWELERAPGGLRPRELEAQLLLAQYNLSRLLDRLERAGLVHRAPCPEDGRGQLVHATAEGLAMRRAMWPVYAAAVGRAVGEPLAGVDAVMLARMLDHLAAAPSMDSAREAP